MKKYIYMIILCAVCVAFTGGMSRTEKSGADDLLVSLYNMKAVTTDYSLSWAFLKDYRTHAAMYKTYIDYIDDSGVERRISVTNSTERDYDAPNTRYKIIDDDETRKYVFTSLEENIDFEKEMLVIYMFTDFDNYGVNINNFNGEIDENNVLRINFNLVRDEKRCGGCAGRTQADAMTAPDTQAYILIKTDKTQINDVVRV